jgi:hypothetical protein
MQKDEQVRERMFSMIISWQQSGLSQKAYCEQHSIRYHVFHYWYKCFRDLQSPATDAGFIPLQIKPFNSINAATTHTELVLPDGKRLLFHQPVSSDYLKAVIS